MSLPRFMFTLYVYTPGEGCPSQQRTKGDKPLWVRAHSYKLIKYKNDENAEPMRCAFCARSSQFGEGLVSTKRSGGTRFIQGESWEARAHCSEEWGRENDFVRPPARALASQVQPQPSGAMKAVPPEKLPTQKKGDKVEIQSRGSN